MKKIIVSLFIVLSIQASAAVDLSGAEAELMAFRTATSNGRPGKMAYTSLYRAFEAYSAAITSTGRGSVEQEKCRNALLEIYPCLSDAAYYYASLNDKETVLKYACAFVDLSLIPHLRDSRLQDNPQYPILSNLAATNLYNKRDYARSIRYFQAYLESGDLTNRERAFEGLARCHFESRDYGSAANICVQASAFYPRNWNILIIGIEAAGHNGNDREMGQMLTKALAIQPGHVGLLEYQGKLFERQRNYVAAAQSFEKIKAQGKATFDHHCHLGFDYYNAGTMAYTGAKQAGTSTVEATSLFRKAAPLLRTVLDQQPYAANVARALAFCYSATNDATRLKETNNTLASLHSPQVDFGALPSLAKSYTPSAETDPVAPPSPQPSASDEDAPLLADVDINIPETGLKRPDTCVVIIANEDYEGVKVDYAKHDGEIFREYCRKMLGVPADQIRYEANASLLKLNRAVDYLRKRCSADPGKMNVIFYYAGHGIPNPVEQRAYLLPIDGEATDYSTGYDLEKLYAQLDEMPAKSVTVFLDACFSGASRGSGMITKGRFVRMKEPDVKATGKTVVFSAASNDEAALPYDEKGHGMFTYHLLKIMQETRGNISLAELGERLYHDVYVKTINSGKSQSPTVRASAGLGSSWKARKLID